ncbi:OmpA family protein [Motilimonas cestriensis]|uniref:OmpA family protein n=1 Tax=Motilimonas cestriensis TaxID=2742685 RepID=UPI003DA1D735
MKKLSLAITLALTSGAAFAGNTYFGGGAGMAQHEDTCDQVGAASCDDKDKSFNAFGGYQFNEHFALEAGYNHLGKTELPGEDSILQGINTSIIGRLPLSTNFSVFGEVGAFGYRSDSLGHRDEGLSPLGGVGATYRINDTLDLQARYRRIENVGRSHNVKTDVNNFGLELVAHIGRGAEQVVVEPLPIEPEPIVTPEPTPVYENRVTSLSDAVLFGFDSYALTDTAKKQLDEAVAFYNANDVAEIQLTGATDKLGNKEYNERLSQARATSVQSYLVQKGVKAEHITTNWQGDTQATGMAESERAQDRHVTIDITGETQVEVK